MKNMKDSAFARTERMVGRCAGDGSSPYSTRGTTPKMRAAGGAVSDDDAGFGDVVGGMSSRKRLDRAGRKKPSASTTVVNIVVSPNKGAGGDEKPAGAMPVPVGPPPPMPPMPPPMPPMMPAGAAPGGLPPGAAPPPAFARGGRVKR